MKQPLTFSETDLSDWRLQDRYAVRNFETLLKTLPPTLTIRKNPEEAAQRFRMKITPYYLGLIDPNDPDCPIAKMAIPDARELTIHPNEYEDPTGDENTNLNNQPAPRIVHRYKDRALLLATAHCGVYCRHCFRRRLAGRSDQNASEFELSAALRYIRRHREIKEVILSGGDPLMMTDDALLSLVERIKKIPHVRVLRIHTRMPVVNPFRATRDLAQELSRFRPLWLVLHVNHPLEVTPTARERWRLLLDVGIPLLNQTVLLKGVNDHVETLRKLGWRLIEAGVQPYYLHHLDLAQGVSHFRVSIQKGLGLIRALQGTLPGYAIPRYVLDIPGGYGKVPLQNAYVQEKGDGTFSVETPDGMLKSYPDPEIDTRY